MFTYYHGTNNPTAVVDAIMGSGQIRTGFHMASDIDVARNYGNSVIEVVVEDDFTQAHVGLINKEGNYNSSVGNSIETVLSTPAAVNELYYNLYNAEVI